MIKRDSYLHVPGVLAAAAIGLFPLPAASSNQAVHICDANRHAIVDAKTPPDMADRQAPCTRSDGACDAESAGLLQTAETERICIADHVHTVTLTWADSHASNVPFYERRSRPNSGVASGSPDSARSARRSTPSAWRLANSRDDEGVDRGDGIDADASGSGNRSQHFVTVTWARSPSPNVAGYNVHRGSASGGPYTRLTRSLAAGTSDTDYSVQAGATYFYVATAVGVDGSESCYSDSAKAVVPIK